MDVRAEMYQEKPTKAKDLLKLLFEQEQPCLTVEAQTITDCDRKLYEPVLNAIGSLKSWNNYDGKKVERFVRDNLRDGNRGPIVAVRFGRAYSPVLYLTLTATEYDPASDEYRRLTFAERCKLLRDFVERIKRELDTDSCRIFSYSPGVVRLWWD